MENWTKRNCFESAEDILEAKEKGRIEFNETGIVH